MYTITDLGTLPGYVPEALDVNEFGAVAGTLHATTPGTPDAAFAWTKFGGGIQKLPDWGKNAEARAINGSSMIVGAAETATAELRAVYWDAQQQIHSLPLPANGKMSFTHDVSDAGLVVGGHNVPGEHGSPPRQIPLRWKTPLQPPEEPTNDLGSGWNEAVAVNVFGTAVGPLPGAGAGDAGFFWAYSSVQISALHPPFGTPAAIDDSGNVVGSWNGQPVRWSGVGLYPIPLLPGWTRGAATGVNEHGFIVGDCAQFDSGPSRAFLYRSSTSTSIALNDLIDPGLGWDLQHATAINKHDEIVGYGLHGGERRSFILSPSGTSGGLGQAMIATVTRILLGGLLDNSGVGLGPRGPIPIPPMGPELLAALRAVQWPDLWLQLGIGELANSLSDRDARSRAQRFALEHIAREAAGLLEAGIEER